MERRLASIQTIKEVLPIFHPLDGAETSIELVTFENIGWQCVAKRGEFIPGDLAVYIEISSIVPEHEVFEFLRARKFKVKTIRLLGVLSQGLALPTSIIQKIVGHDLSGVVFSDGDDLTELLGVTRPEQVENFKITGSGRISTFPTDIVPKTDEIRIQSAPHVLKELEDIGDVVATLKVDGTSATYFWDEEKGAVRVCSRNMEKMEDDGSVYFLALQKYPQIEDMLRENIEFVLQGEIVAPGIQKNRLGVKGVEFFGFNIFNRWSGQYESQYNLEYVLDGYGIPRVPVVHHWRNFNETIESLLEMAKGFYEGTQNHREGLVLRPYYDERWSYLLGGRVSCKVINNDYLLNGGE